MVIAVRSLVPACDTNAHGDIVRDAIVRALQTGAAIDVSFAGITSATTSFVNSAFVDLLTIMSLVELKQRVRITHSTRQINDMIRMRLLREADFVSVAA